MELMKERRVDNISTVASVKELMKEHRKLFPGFRFLLPAEDNITIPPEVDRSHRTVPPPQANNITIILKAKRTISPEAEKYAESNYSKRKRPESDEPSFMNKLKTRFRTLDTDLVESFREIMKKCKEGKKSQKDVHGEVVDLLYYHEDLLAHFSRLHYQKHI
ncbi:uncharacterized protein LOC112084008 [Eutrema salsugineum]|nr:uncharacterized protein LOC112084008 [Eutrema salsugineum]